MNIGVVFGLPAAFRSRGLRSDILRGGLGSLLLKSLNMLLGFSLSVVLARVLGADGYGVYAFVLAATSILAIPAHFGLPQLVLRETARADAAEDWGYMRGVWRWATKAATLMSLGAGVLFAIGVLVFHDRLAPVERATALWALALVPIVAFGLLRDAALRGLRRVLQGQLAESVVRPSTMLALVAVWVATGRALDASSTMALHVTAATVAFLVGAWLLRLARPERLIRSHASLARRGEWVASVLPLALVAGMRTVSGWADLVLVGLILTPADVGVYRAVVQISMGVGFALYAVNQVVAPQFSRLYVEKDHARLRRLAAWSARTVFACSVPVALVLIVWGDTLLDLVYGESFAQGHAALAILAAGQVASAWFGSVAYLLNMTGHESDTARGALIGTACNVGLNVLLIPPFGIEGAAVATAGSTLVWNALLHRMARERLQMDSSALGRAA